MPRHRTSLMVALVLIATFVALASSIGVAQEVDTRLSRDPEQLVLPEEIRIQSAARIGAMRLVVWGTSELDSQSNVSTVLRIQMLVDTIAVGDQQSVVSLPARPFGFVQVLAVDGRFLVVWNDRRSGGGAYCRFVDTSSNAGPEMKFAAQPVSAVGVVTVRVAGGIRLIWNDSASASPIWYRDLINGGIVGRELTLGAGRVQGVIVLTQSPELTVVDRGADPPLPLRRDGTPIQLAPAANSKFAIPYFLDYTGSVATVEGDRLCVYRSLFDSIPVRKTLIRLPDDDPGYTWKVKGSTIVTRDTAGRFQFSYAEFYKYSLAGGYTDVLLRIRRVTELTPMKTTPPVTIDELHAAGTSHQCIPFSGSQKTTIVRGPGNSYLVSHFVITIYQCSSDGKTWTDTTTGIARFGIAARGKVSSTNLPMSYGLEPEVFTRRAIGGRASEIDVAVGSKLLRLTTPAARLTINVPERMPVLHKVDGSVMASWLTLGADSTANLGVWNGTAIDPIEPLTPMVINHGADPPVVRVPTEWRDSLVCLGNVSMLASYKRWNQPRDSGEARDTQVCEIRVPSLQGWKQVVQYSTSDRIRRLKVLAAGRKPETGESVIAISRVTDAKISGDGWIVGLHVEGLSPANQADWIVDSVRYPDSPPGLTIVPIAGDEYLLFDTRGMRRYRGDSLLKSVAIPFVYQDPRYLPMMACRTLRWRIYRPALTTYFFTDIIDTNGVTVYHSDGFTHPPGMTDAFVAQHPIDSGFVVLFSSSGGIIMSRLDKTLRVVQHNVVLSDTRDSVTRPVAVFNGTDLYVAWEDYRNGRPNIYGKVISLPPNSPRKDDGDHASGSD